MWFKSSIVMLGVSVAQPVTAQQVQPGAQILAQALDRCMTTFAVRLMKTNATDEAIYAEATKSCAPLNARFVTAVHAELAPQDAAQLLAEVDAARRPNFYTMLGRIRSDRAKRAAEAGAR